MSGKVTLAELRAEMARLTMVMMDRNVKFLEREKELVKEYGHDPLILAARLDDDIWLRNYSAVAKTCATLAGAMAAVIQAELAYEARYRPPGREQKPCICGAGQSTHLTHTYVCRNQP